MSIDAERVQRWLDAYSHAWETYDPAEIGALFTDDAEYRWHPWDEGDAVARGRAQIVAAWLKDRDQAGTYRGEYKPLLIQGDQATAVGISTYYTDANQTAIAHVFYNLWVLRFADNGQCSSFTEWYMRAPEPSQSETASGALGAGEVVSQPIANHLAPITMPQEGAGHV